MTSNIRVYYMKIKLKGGMPNDNRTQGSILIEQVLSPPISR